MIPEAQGQFFIRTTPVPLQRSTVAADADQPVGILRGARIITTNGLRCVQDMRVGDLVISRDNGVIPVDRIEQRSLIASAIYVIAGSIGHRNQTRDTVLPSEQPVLVRDWRARAFTRQPEAVMQAQELVDGEYVRNIGLQPMTVFRLYCAAPQVLYADGMELGTADVAAERDLAP